MLDAICDAILIQISHGITMIRSRAHSLHQDKAIAGNARLTQPGESIAIGEILNGRPKGDCEMDRITKSARSHSVHGQ
jgi:hypothetical protein